MTYKLREAAQSALEALINGKNVRAGEGGTKRQTPLEDAAIEQLRAALAEPYADKAAEVNSHRIRIDPVTGDVGIGTAGFGKQEPVAWVGWSDVHGYLLWDTKDEAEWMSASDFAPIPVTSPRREWQSLTDDEITEAIRALCPNNETLNGLIAISMDEYRAIEQKLKEKNT